jgi:CheY-like chemotaxis protein
MGQHDAATEPLAELAGKPVILVVEDELLVRIVQVDILREAGFRVAEAQDADEAFDMLRRRPEIAAVLTDVDMPGSLNGFEFARLVKQGWPEVGVLTISGKAINCYRRDRRSLRVPDVGPASPCALISAGRAFS